MKRRVFPISPETTRVRDELQRIKADPYCLSLSSKGIGAALKIIGLSPGQANIVKQEAIASNIDAMVARGTVSCTVEKTDVLVLGHAHGVRILADRLKRQPIGLAAIGDELKAAVDARPPARLKLRNRAVPLDSTLLMAIVNVTPDSFSDGGSYTAMDALFARLDECAEAGVDLVDIGGESTRPGAEAVGLAEELDRVMPAVEAAVSRGLAVSVDTYKADVAQAALAMGAVMINDISGLTFDPSMAQTVADADAALCVMHILGTPKDMQKNPEYDDVVGEVKSFLVEAAETAEAAGVARESIVIDPGFGFGKTLAHNYALLKYLGEFSATGYPVLAGISRKSMIGNVIDRPVTDRLFGTIAAESAAILGGASIVRAHDIEATKDMIRVLDTIRQAGEHD